MSVYEQLSDDLLAGFFVEINKNIQRGILSEGMYYEISLILLVAENRNLSEQDLENIYQKQIESQLQLTTPSPLPLATT
ncbi:hypothetical protein CBR56_29710 [Bacillus thuringiensis]|uniref:hypothetical protein n=1 Tax=Bacillus tropicus TaxID=2026188 RepID=UPI000B42E1FC|nr:hypothetical protein [Bacillus tropicus]MED3038605.1 hypothetical protein [Bacillus tropicus]OTX88341.1 hypothetical protein BK728_05400 [Bacillus thuringiensis serovar chanpaisis]PNK22204.1 hypothetical protein CBR56_29710 [Bacillus thuringiensis]